MKKLHGHMHDTCASGEQINLVEISEMLTSEIYHENGWIARFSKELNK